MHPLDIPQYFSPILEKIEMFSNTAKNLSVSNLELALNYVNEISEIDKIVVGVNKFSQFNEIVNAKKIKINPIDFIENSINNPQFTQPMLWKIFYCCQTFVHLLTVLAGHFHNNLLKHLQ